LALLTLDPLTVEAPVKDLFSSGNWVADRRRILVALLFLLLSLSVVVLAAQNQGRSSAPWPEQVEVVKNAVAAVDKDALPDLLLHAAPTEEQWLTWQIGDGLEVRGRFVRPSGETITFKYLDLSPASSIHVQPDPVSGRNGVALKSARSLWERLPDPLGAVRIAPKEAVERTWPEVVSVVEGHRLEIIRVQPLLELYWPVPTARWRVSYGVHTRNGGTTSVRAGTLDGETLPFLFEVNAESGEIVEREYPPKSVLP
jgi:hypothetical protein